MVNFELTLYTPYMLKISPLIRAGEGPVSLLAAVRHADRDLRQQGADVRRPARRRLAGVRPAETPEAVLKAQGKGKFPDPEHKENFVAVHPQPAAAQRRHRGRPPQRPVDPLRQHQLPPGRPEATSSIRRPSRSSATPRR